MVTTEKVETRVVTLPNRAALHRLVDELPDEDLPYAARLLDGLVARAADPEEQALVDRWIDSGSCETGAHEARLAESYVPLYAIIGQLPVYEGHPDPVGEVAKGYRVPREAVEAALAYYRRHRFLIDARIAMNALP